MCPENTAIVVDWLSRRGLLAIAAGAMSRTARAANARCGQASHGGRLVVALRSEPKTLNPVTALDAISRSVIERITAGLLQIARDTQQVMPALATSWAASSDGKRYTLSLRRGVMFSDGAPFTAGDVVFSFQVYLDETLRSPQRDLLLVGGVPIEVRKKDSHTVEFHLSQPYGAGARLFDGIAMLPRHYLEPAYREGRLAEMGTLSAALAAVPGLGPFIFGEYLPGQRLVLRRNPHYWATNACGARLPYLEELVFVFSGSEAGQVRGFQAGEADVVSRFSPASYTALEREGARRGYRVADLGPGLEHHFLVFNLNDTRGRNLPQIERRQKWFRIPAFRQALGLASDKDAIVRLVFQGRASALASHVTPGNARWLNGKLAPTQRNIPAARAKLAAAGFSWSMDGALLDARGEPVEFTILVTAGNAQRARMAAILEQDWKQLGMRVQTVPLEARAALDRVFRTFDYDTAIMALAGGDADPNAEMNVWTLRGSTHLWNLTAGAGGPTEPWEIEIDQLMRRQLVMADPAKRKQAYDRVQELVAAHLPILPLVAPHVLVGARANLGNFRPAVVGDHALWNAAELYLAGER